MSLSEEYLPEFPLFLASYGGTFKCDECYRITLIYLAFFSEGSLIFLTNIIILPEKLLNFPIFLIAQLSFVCSFLENSSFFYSKFFNFKNNVLKENNSFIFSPILLLS